MMDTEWISDNLMWLALGCIAFLWFGWALLIIAALIDRRKNGNGGEE